MLIGELSKTTGLSRDTIRFYEKNGLIETGKNSRRNNNYKEYSDDVCKRLLLVKKIKSFGFTLREISELLAVIESNAPKCGDVLEMVDAKVSDIETKIRELTSFKLMLLAKVRECRNECRETENCSVFNAEMNL